LIGVLISRKKCAFFRVKTCEYIGTSRLISVNDKSLSETRRTWQRIHEQKAVIYLFSKLDKKFHHEAILHLERTGEEGLKDKEKFPAKKQRMNSDRIRGIVRLWYGKSGIIRLRGKISEIMCADPTASHIIAMKCRNVEMLKC
jgi:hypothetical protein